MNRDQAGVRYDDPAIFIEVGDNMVQEKIQRLREQLNDTNLQLPPFLRLQKIDVLRQLLLSVDEDESDKVANVAIHYATTEMKNIPASDKLKALDILKRSYISVAPRSFHHYLIALEWNREPKNRFYQPRMRILKETVTDLTKLANKEYEMLSISMPPGTGKSTLGIFYLSWLIGRDPMKCNLASGYSDKLTKSFFLGVLGIATDDEYTFHEIFPKCELTNQNSKDTWIDFRDDGSDAPRRFPAITCRSISGSLTGATRCEGILYCDDLVSGIEEAMSLDRMDKLWEKYGLDLKSRKKDGCVELHIATRWTIHDPIGRLQKQWSNNPKAKFIELPALDDKGESNFEYDFGVGFSTKYFMEAKATLDDISFMCLYQQQPVERDGLLFGVNELKYYHDLPPGTPDAVIAFCDVAFGGRDSLSYPIAYQYGDELFIEKVVFTKGDYKVTQPLVVGETINHNVQISLFEANNGGDFYSREVAEQVKALGHKCNIRSERASNKQSKLVRIIQHAPAIKEFYFKDSSLQDDMYRAFMKEVTTFTQLGENKHDDAPDSLAGLANMIIRPSSVKMKTMNRSMIGI